MKAKIVHGRDAGMVQVRTQLGFAGKHRFVKVLFVVDAGPRDNFDCHLPIQSQVASQKDLPHAAVSNTRNQFIAIAQSDPRRKELRQLLGLFDVQGRFDGTTNGGDAKELGFK